MEINQYLSYHTNAQLQVLLSISILKHYKYEFQVAYGNVQPL
jgi:hypothetical protein